ncbi:10175_t:CDS:1, partial [Funneliformis mosseae]
LKIFTQIPDDNKEELSIDIGNEQIQHTLKDTFTNDKQPLFADTPNDTVKDTNIDNIGILQKDEIIIPRITQVEKNLEISDLNSNQSH